MNILDLLFPKRCCGCGKFGIYLCKLCRKNILQSELVCPKCERASIGGVTHPLCRHKYGLDGLWSLGVYQGVLRSAIKKLKYRLIQDLAADLTEITVEYWAKNEPLLLKDLKKDQGKGWMVVPVPLHPKKQRTRGFNQTSLLAKLLAEKIGLEYGEILERVRYTKAQYKLSAWERKKNLRNAFTLSTNNPLPATNCLLIDDVWTTGSTLKECCYVLKKGGTKKVWAITLAR